MMKEKVNKPKRIILGVLLVLALVTVAGCTSNKQKKETTAKPLALVGGVLIDGTGNDAVPDAVVVIRKGKIIAAGKSESIEIPGNAEIINLNGAAILPGFINTHVHYAYDSQTLKAFAQAGVTTVRDMQDSNPDRLENWSWFKERDRLLEDPYNSRLLSVGPMITVPGGYPIYLGDELEKAAIVNSPEEARRITKKLIDAGADTIKVAVERGKSLFTEIPTLSQEEVTKIVKEAHKNSVKVAAHITHSQDIPAFLAAGGDEIAHMVLDDELTDDLIKKLVEADVYFGPTMELFTYVEKAPFVLAVDPNYQSYAPALENLKRFVKAGGKVVLGTDFGGLPGGLPGGVPFQSGMPMIEIEAMLEAEMTPMEVIMAATKNAAYICNQADNLGTLEPDKIADILVVKGNPLEDIQALTRPVLVVHNGFIIRNEL